jgi:hypothetical protein
VVGDVSIILRCCVFGTERCVLVLDLDHDVMVHLCQTALFPSMLSTYVSVSNSYINFSLLGSLLLHSSDWCE